MRPKSVARELYESYHDFESYVRQHNELGKALGKPGGGPESKGLFENGGECLVGECLSGGRGGGGLTLLAQQAMVINPAVEVFLLDTEGTILAHTFPPESIVKSKIDIKSMLLQKDLINPK